MITMKTDLRIFYKSFQRKARWIRAVPESDLGLCPRVLITNGL